MMHKLQQDNKYLLTFEVSECARHYAVIMFTICILSVLTESEVVDVNYPSCTWAT